MTHEVVEEIDETSPALPELNIEIPPQSIRKVTRFSLDLDKEQHKFLKLFALSNDVKASLVVRALLYLLETDINLANRVIDEIIMDEEVPS